ncbi:beta-ketoadipate enol-lactone hydrolase [Myroides odoratimimus]|uniref:Hydrolase n=2 Tax=Myroides odoratimimus TaxID=76832 RepID=A0A0S7EF84_9FLAO|nr:MULTISPECIES: alpha/beta hydrolase [Myroides]AJA68159.1 putative hydrolase or acyltransferase (alpha/beta hydrolase superfamily) [Myroides sp. A21]ALU25465.1 hydrolase [Myroides odoratimimus]EHO06824.1 hypothetical protein HMPREF9712_03029 [Myroides odoratimimus CCUG 10230]MDM1035499.1 alpha/beta hydrolase [Myroides odoratimimus]MDM1065723.1 alpha/beta hydrolase [Myroides odoratimimus]
MATTKILYKNTNLSYTDKGKGSTLIFLHGFLEDSKMWNYYLDYFSKKYRVIAIDLLGHGESGCIGYIHSMEDMADAVFTITNSLNLKRVTLIGHSMGGYVSLAFGELYPDNVKKIILVSSTTRADSPERQINRDRATEVIKKNSDLFVTMAINNTFLEDTKITHAKEVQEHLDTALKIPKQGILAAVEGMKSRNDREVLLHFAPYPISMIVGNADPVLSIDDITKEVENTDSDLTIIPGGHLLQIEAKEELLEALKNTIK